VRPSIDGNTTDSVVKNATDAHNRFGLEALHFTPSVEVSLLFVNGLFEDAVGRCEITASNFRISSNR